MRGGADHGRMRPVRQFRGQVAQPRGGHAGQVDFHGHRLAFDQASHPAQLVEHFFERGRQFRAVGAAAGNRHFRAGRRRARGKRKGDSGGRAQESSSIHFAPPSSRAAYRANGGKWNSTPRSAGTGFSGAGSAVKVWKARPGVSLRDRHRDLVGGLASREVHQLNSGVGPAFGAVHEDRAGIEDAHGIVAPAHQNVRVAGEHKRVVPLFPGRRDAAFAQGAHVVAVDGA